MHNHDQIIPHWTIGVVHFSYIPVELQRFKVHEIWLCCTSMATCASIGFWVHSCVASFPPPPHEIIQKKNFPRPSLPMLPTIWTIQITIHHIIQLQRRLQGREYDLPTVRCLLGENRPKVLHKSAFQELNTWSIAQTLWNWLLYKLRILMNNLYRPHVRLIKCRTYTYL